MEMLYLSPKMRTALKDAFLGIQSVRRHMSQKRRTISVVAFLFAILPTSIVIGYQAGQYDLDLWPYIFPFGCFIIGMFVHEVIFALELIEKKEYETEMEAASRIQSNLLPDNLPAGDNITFARFFESAKEIGGDYHDVIELGNGRYAIIVVDVSGKGVPASILMATARAQILGMIWQDMSPGELVSRLNEGLFRDTTTTQYATLFLAIVETNKMSLNYVNAGHATPLLVSKGGVIRHLDTGGLPAGMFSGTKYEQGTEPLGPGDRIVAYTDGVTDAGESRGCFLELEDLEELICQNHLRTAQGLTDAILASVDSLRPPGERADDITLLIAAL
jgi:sigma-B regulation protein RsbU (phosphoserine phosphatase)